MNSFKLAPMGAALLGLALISAAPTPARAGKEDYEGKPAIIRIAQDDRDNDRDGYRDRDSSEDSGYLGVQVQRLSASLRRAKGIPESTEGTLVSSVEDGSPADDAGIKRGDVILEVNRQDTPNPGELVRVVRSLDPGRRASVLIWRDGVTRTYNLKVGSRPSGSDMPMPPPSPPNWGGGPDRDRDIPNEPRVQILRRNREDIDRQIRDLQAQVTRLEAEIRELQQQLNRRDRDDHDRGGDRDRDHNDDD